MLEQHTAIQSIGLCLGLLSFLLSPFAIAFVNREEVHPVEFVQVLGRMACFFFGVLLGVWLFATIWLGVAVGLEMARGEPSAVFRSFWLAGLSVPLLVVFWRSPLWVSRRDRPALTLVIRGGCVGFYVALMLTAIV
jgi:hypothetical protein